MQNVADSIVNALAKLEAIAPLDARNRTLLQDARTELRAAYPRAQALEQVATGMQALDTAFRFPRPAEAPTETTEAAEAAA